MKIKEVMSPKPVTLLEEDTLQQAADILGKYKIDSVPVVNKRVNQ